jgi:hypothetical protein
VQTTTLIRRSSEKGETASLKSKILFTALLAGMVFATGCGGDEETQDDSTEGQGNTEQTASTQDRTENTRAGGENTMSRNSGGGVMLSIEGDSGTEFSGTCSVGDEAYELSGEVPESFDYDLEGQQLECEIRQESAGNLNVLLTGPGDRIQQQANTPGGTISLVYSENGVSSSTSSSGASSSSVNQVVSSSSSGSSSSSVSSSSR